MISKEYRYQVGEVVNETLRVVKQTRETKYNRKAYEVQSIVYPDAPTYEIQESYLKQGIGCSYTAGRSVFEGNSLWSIKSIRKYIIEEEEAKNITPKTNKKIKVKCDNCGNEKMMIVSNLINRGISCFICSRKTSYPELFFSAYNEVMNLNFKPQQRFEDFEGYIFDFVNYEKRVIVETHGVAHYKKDHSWHERTHKSDMAKRKYCKENNWTLIELDCRKSEFNHIKNSINESNEILTSINAKNTKKILKIIKKNKRYNINEIIKMYQEDKLTTYQIGNKIGVSYDAVNNILRRNNIKLRAGGSKKKQVKCITTNIVYNSITEASVKTGASSGHITEVCKGKRKSAGKHSENGEKLTWEYI